MSVMKDAEALQKELDETKKRRRFYEPPGDQGGNRRPRVGWTKREDGRWICPLCAA